MHAPEIKDLMDRLYSNLGKKVYCIREGRIKSGYIVRFDIDTKKTRTLININNMRSLSWQYALTKEELFSTFEEARLEMIRRKNDEILSLASLEEEDV